ncbi:unnamed protein product [Vicia faba]|uniref:Uncharacterized protein n=1 Tax=Vicia faba TaxID=3906 RepID=A0AAV1AJ47_VICFA|nr:unnamed protein product [Vicia faba]
MSPISVDDIVAEDRDCSRVKGKGLLIHPSSDAINAGTIHNDSSPVANYEEASGSFNKPRNSFETRERQGGWRTTHNDKHLYGVSGHHSRNNYNECADEQQVVVWHNVQIHSCLYQSGQIKTSSEKDH